MTVAAFFSVLLIHLLAAMSPGPSFVVCVRTAAVDGFRIAVALAFGYALGAFLWALAAMAGLLVFPVVIVLVLVIVFSGISDIPAAQGAMRGMGAAVAGLIAAKKAKLGDEKFAARAPANVIQKEREQLAEMEPLLAFFATFVMTPEEVRKMF